jgi:hypothetical protein
MLARLFFALSVVTFLAVLNSVEAVDVECPIIADTLLAGHTAEKDTNCGVRAFLRVKGYQGIVVFRFDMSKLKGQKVDGGTLSVYCASITGDAAGKTISEAISTISHDWIEGAGDYTFDENSATFLWPGKAIDKTWGEENEEKSDRYGPIDALDVTGGFGGSILNKEGVWEFQVGKWTDIELDAELVQGLVDGTQYGVAVMRNSIGVNLDLASKEHAGGDFAARLVVQSRGFFVAPNGKLTTTWGIVKSTP